MLTLLTLAQAEPASLTSAIVVGVLSSLIMSSIGAAGTVWVTLAVINWRMRRAEKDIEAMLAEVKKITDEIADLRVAIAKSFGCRAGEGSNG